MGAAEYRHNASRELNANDMDNGVRAPILQPHRLRFVYFN